MVRTGTSPRKLVAPLSAATALALAAPALAQAGGDFRDFRLPPKPTQAAPVVGPADGDAPAPRAATPAPGPAPSAAPNSAVPAPTPTANRQPAAPRSAAPARPAPTSPTLAPPPAQDTGNALQIPTAPSPIAPGLDSGLGPPLPALPAPIAPESESNWWLWPLLAAVAAMLAGIGWTVWKRRTATARSSAPEFVRPLVPDAERAPAPAPDLPPVATPSDGPALVLTLDVTRMSASLVNATLSYRLMVTNTGPVRITGIAIAGDMISAHSSVPQQELLDAGAAAMPVLHSLEGLAPGESATLAGDIRLPLTAITPIRHGEARLFVPLARFRSAGLAGSEAIAGHSAFLVGQEPQTRARLQPFRLDLGPRNYSQVGQRPIVLAA